MQKQRSTSDSPFPHGTVRGYWRGCRCDACRAANAEYGRRRYATHREEALEYWRQYRMAHREEMAAYDRKRYAAHRDKVCDRVRRYRMAHPEKVAEAKRKWRAEHPERRAATRRNRRARECGNGGTHTAADVRAQYERQKGRCYWCGQKLGRNYHVDHVIPIALGGSNGPENLVIACAKCNASKGAKHPMEFAGVMF